MSSKWNYVFGGITIAVIIGGTIYAIKKSRDVEEEESQAISLKEAREILEKRKQEKTEDDELAEEIHFEAKIEEVDEEPTSKIVGIKATTTVYDEVLGEEYEDGDEYEVDGDPGYDKYENVDERTESPYIEPLNDFNYFEEGINPKEDKELRHDPNSREAKYQYIRMELADWEPHHPVYRMMIQLFEFPFIPTTDGDEVLRTQIIDHKVQFFGWNSKWNKEVSFADVIFHYARSAEFNCGESVQYWVEYFLDFNEFEWDSTSQQVDLLLGRLNSHSYFNEERQTFGLFGLTRESMDQAIRIANRNIDRSVTYEIEFNEFLKTCL